MKVLRETILTIINHRAEWFRILWRPYVSMAVCLAFAIISLLRVSQSTLLPLWVYRQEINDWALIWNIICIDVPGIVFLSIAFIGSFVTSVWAHRMTKATISDYAKRGKDRPHRNLLIVKTSMLMFFVVLVFALPSVVIFISGIAAARSGMMLDVVSTPVWANLLLVFTSFCGIFGIEIMALMIRASFRIMSIKKQQI